MAALQGSNPPAPPAPISEGLKPLLNGGSGGGKLLKQECLSPPRSRSPLAVGAKTLPPMSPLNNAGMASAANSGAEDKNRMNNNMTAAAAGGRLKFYKGKRVFRCKSHGTFLFL